MNIIWLLLGVSALGVIYAFIYGFNREEDNSKPNDHHDVLHYKSTEKAMKKIMKLFDKKDTIHNNDVEELLSVSDSTATRYLDRLEERNKIEQIGSEGRGVYYKKK